MVTNIDAYDLNPARFTGTRNFYIDFPHICPCCSTAYSSNPSFSGFFKNTLGTMHLYCLFFCPACEDAFLVTYDFIDDIDYDECVGNIAVQYPFPNNTTSFSDKLSELSPKFVEIYHQAEQAENAGLSELCGIGYRKALEFLVKDYAIAQHPDKESEIISSFLGKCIHEYIDNPKIEALATASTWIGNDETHYVRKHENYNVQDLKRFLTTTIAYVECELNLAEAFDFLNGSQ